MRGGSLTRFRTDEWYDQSGKGLVTDIMRGGLQGLKRTRNTLKLPSNTLSGLKTGITRGVKRKAEEVIKREITKRAKKALGDKNVKKAVRVASALFPKQVKRARDIFGVYKMDPVHSRPRRIRSDRGLPQRRDMLPFWKLMRRPPQRRQRGGWLDLAQRWARRQRY